MGSERSASGSERIVVEGEGHAFEFTFSDLEFCVGGLCYDLDGSFAGLKEAINNPDFTVREAETAALSTTGSDPQ